MGRVHGGGCAVAYAWNTFGASYFAGIFFAEQTFVGLHGIVAAIDLWKRNILNNKKWRVVIYNIAFILLAVIDFFSFAVTSTTFDDAGLDNAGPAFLALFYFCILVPGFNEKMGKPIILLILAASFVLCAVCLLIGYFILVAQFEGVSGTGYFVGIGFFVLAMAIIIACDMMLDRFIPGYKDGGNSVSDQQAQNAGNRVTTEESN